MEGIDWNLIVKEGFHSSPYFLAMFSLAFKFMKAHQETSEKIQKSVQHIELALAAADLPRLKEDVRTLQEKSIRFEQQLLKVKV